MHALWDELGASVFVPDEVERARLPPEVVCQNTACERPRDEVLVSMLLEHESAMPLDFLRSEKTKAGLDERWAIDVGRVYEPEVHR